MAAGFLKKSLRQLSLLGKAAKRSNRISNKVDTASAALNDFFEQVAKLSKAAPPTQEWGVEALARVMRKSEPAIVYAALDAAGVLPQIQKATTPRVSSNAILVTGLLVGLEGALLVAISSADEIQGFIEELLDAGERLLGFDLTQISRIKGLIDSAPGLVDEVLAALENLGVNAIDLAATLDAMVAEQAEQFEEYGGAIADFADRAETFAPEIVGTVKAQLRDVEASVRRTAIQEGGKLLDRKDSLVDQTINLLEEF